MFLSDAANSVIENLGVSFSSVSLVVRLVVQIYFLALILRSRDGYALLLVLLFFYGTFVIGTAAAIGNLYPAGEYAFLENFKIINKMLFFFIAWETLRKYFYQAADRQRLLKLFGILATIQAVVVLASFFLDIQIFAGYLRESEGRVQAIRFGYQGLIPAQNEVSLFFVIAFFYFLLKFDHRPDGKNLVLLALTTFASLLTGTKVALVLPVLLAVYLFAALMKSSSRKAALLGILLILFSIPFAYAQRDEILRRIEPTINYYVYRIETSSSPSQLLALTEGRRTKADVLFSNYLPEMNFLNYLFGGIDLRSNLAEIDPVDVFFRLGMIGGFFYYLLYLRVLLYPHRRVALLRWIFVATWLSISSFAGHIVFTAINGTYLAILILAFSYFETKGREERAVAAQPAMAG